MPDRQRWTALAVTAIWLTATHQVTAGSQCPNLSGHYLAQGEDGQVHILIDQHNCDRIKIVMNNYYLGTKTSEIHTLKLDGNEQTDSPWFGSSGQNRTSAKFVGSQLQVRSRPARGMTITLIYSLTPGRDLLEGSPDDGGESPVVAKRQN